MLDGKITGVDYNRLCETANEMAENDSLPMALQIDDVSHLSMRGFETLFQQFQEDTGLQMTGHLFLCDGCGKLHCLLEINFFDDEEDTLLQ